MIGTPTTSLAAASRSAYFAGSAGRPGSGPIRSSKSEGRTIAEAPAFASATNVSSCPVSGDAEAITGPASSSPR